MPLLDITNEALTLVAQIAIFVFPIGIAIYAFEFPIMRECVNKLSKTAINQHERLSKKIVRLFFAGVVTVFYAVIVKIVISQFTLCDCVLWLFLVGAIILLLIIFFCLYSIFPEIGLVDE